MIKLRFPNDESHRQAVGYLAGRFPFKLIASGLTLVPEGALASLAAQGISFTVEGAATYDEIAATVRDTAPSEVQ